MKRDNYKEAITPHVGATILVPSPKEVPLGDTDGIAYVRTKTLGFPAARPVLAARENADGLKDEDLLKRFDPGGDLLSDFELAEALESDDGKRAGDVVSRKMKWPRRESPENVFAHRVTDGLDGARLVIWRDSSSGKLRPGILCETAKQAAYALLVERLGGPGGWSLCKRCGGVFQKRRAKQPYCSSRCRINDAMKRYRKRKAKLEMKGRKAGR